MTSTDLPVRRAAGAPARRFGMHGVSSAGRIQRFGAFALAVGYGMLAVLALASYPHYRGVVEPWWPGTHLAGLLVCAAIWGVVGWANRPDWVGPAAVVSWVMCLASVLSWQPAWNGADLDLLGVADRPILQNIFLHLPAVALILARRSGWAVLALVSCVGIGAVGVGQLSYGRLDLELLMATLWSIGVTLVYLALVRAVMVAADRTDQERRRALRAARRGSWYIARDREGQRLDALVHDRIIALLAELDSGRSDAFTAEQARSVLDELADWESAADAELPGRALTGAEISTKLATAVSELGGASGVQIDLEEVPGAEYPFEAAVALSDAAVEAVRNARLHGGPAVTCLARIAVRADDVVVEVVDDGVGFEPQSLPPTAIGVPIAIGERMHRLPGGSSVVDSELGAGTRVRLAWHRAVAGVS